MSDELDQISKQIEMYSRVLIKEVSDLKRHVKSGYQTNALDALSYVEAEIDSLLNAVNQYQNVSKEKLEKETGKVKVRTKQ